MASKKLRLVNDLILIKLDPDTEMVGRIVKPDGALDHVLRAGKVIDIGPGRWAEKKGVSLNKRIPIDLEVGEGVVFVRFVADGTRTARAIQEHVGADYALLKPNDVLLAFDHNNPPEIGQP